MMNLEFAFSPCPNDTFAFDGWVHKKIQADFAVQPALHDIWELNIQALKGRYPISKVSAYCLGKITKEYAMLPTGCALGFHAGPKLIAKRPLAAAKLSDYTIAVPGEHTSAHLLLEILLGKPKKIIFLPYHQIVPAILNGLCDGGVIIHETRFSYHQYGLIEVADLGELFSKEYGLPIPLGMVVIKRSLGKGFAQIITRIIQSSIAFAKMNPRSSLDYVTELSQEKDKAIIQKHIDLYVNADTYEISKQSLQAIETLFQVAIDRKLLDRSALEFMF